MNSKGPIYYFYALEQPFSARDFDEVRGDIWETRKLIDGSGTR